MDHRENPVDEVARLKRERDEARAVAEMSIEDVSLADNCMWGEEQEVLLPEVFCARRLAELRKNVASAGYLTVGDWTPQQERTDHAG